MVNTLHQKQAVHFNPKQFENLCPERCSSLETSDFLTVKNQIINLDTGQNISLYTLDVPIIC
jgi:hypothetical protein